ncbi:MAG TPA: universal stress protein, partial [Vicinamibacteria bacterium]|nr:universal stress protein [Vicinamibacteria bacterium]
MPAPGFSPRRIVVALDASPASLAALEAAGRLAARLQAELLGLFVEDVNLRRLVELPMASHYSLSSGSGLRLDAPALESQLRELAARARTALDALASRLALHASFRVARGSVTTELLTAAGEGDLLILGRAGHSLARHEGLGGTARSAARDSPGPVLLLPPGASLAGPVVVVQDASATSRPALEAGRRIAEVLGEELVVLATAPTEAEAAELARGCRRAAKAAGSEVRVRAL